MLDILGQHTADVTGKDGFLMPLYTPKLTHINSQIVQQYVEQRSQDNVDSAIITAACSTILHLAKPQAVFQQVFFDTASQHILCSAPFHFKSQQILPYLEQASIILSSAITLGTAIEKEIDDCFLAKDFTRGIALDSAATVASGQLLDMITQYIKEICEPKGYKIIWRFSPGNGDWPVSQQTDVANAAGGSQIGLSITAGGMLNPRKSLTAMFGLRSTENGCSGSCSGCALSGHCHE